MPRKYYSKVHFFTIDSPTQDGNGPLLPPASRVRESDHRFFCRQMEDVVREVFGLPTRRFYTAANFSKKTFFVEIGSEIDDKEEDELLIVYYHGKAGGKKAGYRWAFSKSPNKPIDARELIAMFCNCKADVLMFLDCPMPTSMMSEWHRHEGTTEIIHSGGELRDVNGEVVEDDENDSFTQALIDGLEYWAEGVNDPEKEKNVWFSTVREVLKGNKELSYKAGSILVQGKESDVNVRIKLGRNQTGRGKLEFFGDVRPKPRRDDEAAESKIVMDDEAVQDMEGDGVADGAEQGNADGSEVGGHADGEGEGPAGGNGQSTDAATLFVENS